MTFDPQAPTTKSTCWSLWVWLAWLLPPALFLVKIAIAGGAWEMVILIWSAPIWWPLFSLAFVAPRFILRRRGTLRAPVLVTLASWVTVFSAVAMFAFLRTMGDSGTDPSPLGTMITFGEGVEDTAMMIGFYGTIVGLVLANVLALTLPVTPFVSRANTNPTLTASGFIAVIAVYAAVVALALAA